MSHVSCWLLRVASYTIFFDLPFVTLNNDSDLIWIQLPLHVNKITSYFEYLRTAGIKTKLWNKDLLPLKADKNIKFVNISFWCLQSPHKNISGSSSKMTFIVTSQFISLEFLWSFSCHRYRLAGTKMLKRILPTEKSSALSRTRGGYFTSNWRGHPPNTFAFNQFRNFSENVYTVSELSCIFWVFLKPCLRKILPRWQCGLSGKYDIVSISTVSKKSYCQIRTI